MDSTFQVEQALLATRALLREEEKEYGESSRGLCH